MSDTTDSEIRLMGLIISQSALIGVAVAIPTFENVMDYVGVNFDGVVTSNYGGWDPTEPIDEDLDRILNNSVSSVYDRFIRFVADSRSQSYDAVKAIAGGRVWIGTAAEELGLVDEIGGIDEALNHAAELSELTGYKVEYYGQESLFGERLIGEFLESVGVSIKSSNDFLVLDSMLKLYKTLIEIRNPRMLLACGGCLVGVD